MNIRKVAVVSILCIVIVVSAFLIYHFWERPNVVGVEVTFVEQYQMFPPYLHGKIEIPVTIGFKNKLDSDVNVTFRIWANIWTTILIANSEKNVSVIAQQEMPETFSLIISKESVEILKVEIIANRYS